MVKIDLQLLQQCKKGSIEAQMELYNMLFASAFHCACRIVGATDAAQDIVQEGFLKIFDRIDHYFEAPQMLQYSLRRIVINASIDALRRRNVQFVEIDEKQCAGEEPIDESELLFTVEKVKRAIEKLPAGYKTIISLRLFEDMDFKDIATELSISDSTARSQYIRAKRKILEMI